jgi:RNA polymerase sigma-70 factor (ECF subfamily)
MVYRSHGGQVWRAVLVMTAGRREIADEATSEAFARLFDYRNGVRDPAAWVFRTAFRLAASELRREAAIRPELSQGVVLPTSVLPSNLTVALKRLSPDQRIAVFLHYYADLPISEVAKLSGSSSATVKVRLHRARRSLRAILEPMEAGHA